MTWCTHRIGHDSNAVQDHFWTNESSMKSTGFVLVFFETVRVGLIVRKSRTEMKKILVGRWESRSLFQRKSKHFRRQLTPARIKANSWNSTFCTLTSSILIPLTPILSFPVTKRIGLHILLLSQLNHSPSLLVSSSNPLQKIPWPWQWSAWMLLHRHACPPISSIAKLDTRSPSQIRPSLLFNVRVLFLSS